MPKKEKRIEFNRTIILETAEKLFSQKGVKETTMNDISKAADYSKSTIYVYFKSKDDIYHYLIYAHMCDLYEMIHDCIKDYQNFEQCYFRICTILLETYEQHPFYFKSMMGNISIDEKDMSENEVLKKIYEIGEEINSCIHMLFEKGIQENYLREDILILPTVYTLWALLANTITIANEKEIYIEQRMKLKKTEFMQYGFQLLLLSIQRR